jgi:hypothetical protein
MTPHVRRTAVLSGAVSATLAHLMWGDQIWIARFDGGDGPSGRLMDAFGRSMTGPTLWAERPRLTRASRLGLDGRAGGISGDLTWYSGFFKTDMSRS